MFTKKNPWLFALMCATDGGDGGGAGDGQQQADSGSQPGEPGAGAQPPATGEGDRGYPANTPVKDMTDAQQAAYWRFHSQKWEGRAKSREDYDSIKSELDQLKQEQMSDHEKALEQAKKDGRAEAGVEFGTKLAHATLQGALQGKGFSAEQVSARLEFADMTKFLTSDGEVDADKVNTFLGGIDPVEGAGDGRGRQEWPDMGQGRRGNPSGKGIKGSVQAGSDLFAERKNKKIS